MGNIENSNKMDSKIYDININNLSPPPITLSNKFIFDDVNRLKAKNIKNNKKRNLKHEFFNLISYPKTRNKELIYEDIDNYENHLKEEENNVLKNFPENNITKSYRDVKSSILNHIETCIENLKIKNLPKYYTDKMLINNSSFSYHRKIFQ